MTHRLRPLILLIALSCMTAWAQPALAARLASVNGQADATEVRQSSDFKLGDQSAVEVTYNITKRANGCAVQVRIHREVRPGQWLVVNTVLRTSSTVRGSKSLTLPAGSYRVEVVATHARFSVSVDK